MTRIAVVGDYSDSVTAHRAINASLDAMATEGESPLSFEWLATPQAETADLTGFNGIWCTPASPYASEHGAVRTIAHARTSGTPFFGTCGGYQHAVLEFARNVLGMADADNTEVNPDAAVPLINGLRCALVEVEDRVTLLPDSRAAKLAGTSELKAAYHCSYGVNRAYLDRFDGTAMRFTGFDLDGDPRVFEIASHPFFLGTAFQPERDALADQPHALVSAFVAACHDHSRTQRNTETG
ncbi:MAG: hypothetical protein AAF499_05575 [Pseudomonadota bacterium]